MSEGEAAARCPEGEAHLLEVPARLSFLANYTLESVKSIGVQYFRHSKKPSFTHRIVRIIQRFLDFSEMDKEMEAYVATASVYFKSKGTADKQLNLSPFVIDENAFNPKATLAKLRYFNGYEKKANAYFFQHSYKPRDLLLQIREPYEGGRAPFKVIAEQFDAFAQLIFQKPMAGIQAWIERGKAVVAKNQLELANESLKRETLDKRMATAQSSKVQRNYEQALLELNDIQAFVESNNIAASVELDSLQEQWDQLARFMEKGDRYNQNDSTLPLALEEYEKAYSIAQDSIIALKITQTKEKIENRVELLLNQTEMFIRTEELDLARGYLNYAARLKPEDSRIRNLKVQYGL